MNALSAKPGLLKQANVSLLRNALHARGTATRAQLARDTGISSTTVRSLLGELLENGELDATDLAASSGGRRAQCYRLRPESSHCAAFCVAGRAVHALLVNACGEIVQTECLRAEDEQDDIERVIASFLDALPASEPLRALGVGVGGAVDGGSYWRTDAHGALVRSDLGAALAARYGLPVVLENDVNATAVGFGRCYEKQFPREDTQHTNMAYVQLSPGCVSAGFLVGGKIVRGAGNFAGELGLLPSGCAAEQTLAQQLAACADDAAYSRVLTQALCWICGILNPQYIALGGTELRKSCLAAISDGLCASLPRAMTAELLYCADPWHDYHSGMAALTAAKLFEDVQLVKG